MTRLHSFTGTVVKVAALLVIVVVAIEHMDHYSSAFGRYSSYLTIRLTSLNTAAGSSRSFDSSHSCTYQI